MDLQELQYMASVCEQCNIHKDRYKPAFDRGDPNSGVLICGMCPGPDENKIGRPFIGPAGKILDSLINNTIKGSPYITNLVKCYVKPGIKLSDEWMRNCLPYFITQLKIINPKVIVALGGDVSGFLTGTNISIGKLRQKEFKYMDIPVVCTYHPSYYARGGGENHKYFYKGLEDFNLIKNYIES